ncbi:hypothetical protein B0J13DRAFT_529023 [Dactylonectria estremocensis]|uniref:Uncharacterized protein n=1 Tax=Dactylonectria estremocensis TaxID=1079267 RepID=A0A9P9E8M9_9HYPO|nr:hypothetical protein B0J13DRAFT_529023 [Dactylonectria estremocensis]
MRVLSIALGLVAAFFARGSPCKASSSTAIPATTPSTTPSSTLSATASETPSTTPFHAQIVVSTRTSAGAAILPTFAIEATDYANTNVIGRVLCWPQDHSSPFLVAPPVTKAHTTWKRARTISWPPTPYTSTGARTSTRCTPTAPVRIPLRSVISFANHPFVRASPCRVTLEGTEPLRRFGQQAEDRATSSLA